MKEMKNRKIYTDKEWEELASMLSEEQSDRNNLLGRFLDEDTNQTGKKWKELTEMNSEIKPDVDEAWKSVFSRLEKNLPGNVVKSSGSGFLSNILIRIAAGLAILISLGIASLYIINNDVFSKTMIMATGSDEKNLKVSLPDGSIIFLNRNTELSYNANFGKNRRIVKLTGEAFFDISPDNSKPFIVDAGSARVKVTGTSFNVITKNEYSDVEVFVKTGKVILSDNTGSQSLILDPGFVGTLGSENAGKKINQNPNYLSWNTGLLVYNGEKLDVVFNDLKRVYNMDIVADDPDILYNTWTSPIDNQSQETIIRLICASFNLSYRIDGTIYHLEKN